MKRGTLATLLVLACRSAPDPAPAPAGTAAIIVHPTPQSRSALLQAVTDALGAKVMLADHALTRESTLVVERSAEALRMVGRDLGTPEKFRLEIVGNDCVLIHDRTGRRFTLVATECAPLR